MKKLLIIFTIGLSISCSYKESNADLYDRYGDSSTRYFIIGLKYLMVKDGESTFKCAKEHNRYYLHLRDSIWDVMHPPSPPIDTTCYPLKP